MTDRRKYSGFTLIELLVVIAIIAILAAIILPVFAAAREHARRNACSSNLGKIGQALELYRQDQGGFPPSLWDRNPLLVGSACTGGFAGLNRFNTTADQAWTSGLLLLMGKASLRVSQSPLSAEGQYLAQLPAYLGDIQDFHCPDNPVGDTSDVSYVSKSGDACDPSGNWTNHAGYDNYDGPDEFAASQYTPSDNAVSTRKYTLIRLTANDFGNDFTGTGNPKDYQNPDYTRQFGSAPQTPPAPPGSYSPVRQFSHPDSDTVVTWCTKHRRIVNGIPTPTGGKEDLVLFLDGKVVPKTFIPFNTFACITHPIQGNGLRSETEPMCP